MRSHCTHVSRSCTHRHAHFHLPEDLALYLPGRLFRRHSKVEINRNWVLWSASQMVLVNAATNGMSDQKRRRRGSELQKQGKGKEMMKRGNQPDSTKWINFNHHKPPMRHPMPIVGIRVFDRCGASNVTNSDSYFFSAGISSPPKLRPLVNAQVLILATGHHLQSTPSKVMRNYRLMLKMHSLTLRRSMLLRDF